MLINCPHCGGKIAVNGLGRPALNITVKNVYDALQLHRNVTAAARELGCSRAYIYMVLKTKGLKFEDVAKGKVAIK